MSSGNFLTLKGFDKTVEIIPGFGNVPLSELAREPSLTSCTPEKVRKVGGPIAREFLIGVEESLGPEIRLGKREGLHPIVDVRVQRLMPGMYPSIPGWHCDAVPRRGYFSQPDFSLIRPHHFHVTGIASTSPDVSNTVFLNQGKTFTFEFDDQLPIWRQLHEEMDISEKQKRDAGMGPDWYETIPGELILFNSYTPHKTSPTMVRGWRLFFRYSMYHQPPIRDIVESQQQVYILSEANGW